MICISVYNTHCVEVCMKTLGRCLAGQPTGWSTKGDEIIAKSNEEYDGDEYFMIKLLDVILGNLGWIGDP